MKPVSFNLSAHWFIFHFDLSYLSQMEHGVEKVEQGVKVMEQGVKLKEQGVKLMEQDMKGTKV